MSGWPMLINPGAAGRRVLQMQRWKRHFGAPFRDFPGCCASVTMTDNERYSLHLC
jgi:hypothetical protein